MIHSVLSYLWDSAFAQFGIAGLVLIAAIAVFLWVPLSGARHVAVAVATVAIIFLFLAPKLYIEGIRYEKAKWDAAEAAAVKRGDDARADAEREIAPLAPEPAAPAASPAGPAGPGPAPEAVDSSGGRGLARILHPRVRPGAGGVRNNDRHDRDNR